MLARVVVAPFAGSGQPLDDLDLGFLQRLSAAVDCPDLDPGYALHQVSRIEGEIAGPIVIPDDAARLADPFEPRRRGGGAPPRAS